MLTFKSYFLEEKERLKFEDIVIDCFDEEKEEEILNKDDRELLKIYLQCIN